MLRSVGRALLAVFALSLHVLSAAGATLQVDKAAGCSDVTGTPYCTINAAILAATSGDTIEIAAGTYATAISAFSKSLTFVGSGSSSAGTVITKSMVYNGTGPLSVSNLRIQGGGSNLRISGTGAFSGLTLADAAFVGNGSGAHGVFVKQNGTVSNVTVTNCTFTNHGQSGFLMQRGTGASTAVDGVTISGSTFDGNGEYGVRIDPRATNVEISSSSITNNDIDGIVFLDTDGALLQDLAITGNRNGILLIPLTSAQSVSNIQLTGVNASNNTRFISGQYGSGMALSGTFGAISNVTAVDSTFSGNAIHGVTTSGQVSGLSIGCSIVGGNAQHGVANGSSALVSAEHVYWGCAGGPGASGCSTVSGDVDFSPFRATAEASCSGGGEELPPDPATVAPPIDPTKISNIHDTTAFLYTGSNPIQRDVPPGTIDRLRAAVLRGLVSTRVGAPLPGVRVTIAGHPEYGSTLTRADGWYDLAVNGGGSLTIHFEKNGYIPADRVQDIPWNRFVSAPDVALVTYDPMVTTVTLGSAQAQVARASVVTDEDGSRQATLIVQPGTTATMTLASGGTQPLSVASVRATEFSVGPNGPKAMPAELPPHSGYTYCVELSADEGVAAGATRIDFDTPVAFYVENFLGFPAGGAVPTGYYDRNCGKWVAAPNGRIVTIVGIVEGRAYLDIDGDAQQDDSDALLGTTIAEREQLALLYGAGTVLWRVPIPHFTPWDHNWPFGPPGDAIAPPGSSPVCERPGQCSVREGGSIIECEAQNLGESVGIVGTPFTLSYNSSRVPGRTTARRVQVDATGDFLPSSVRRVEVEIDVAGRRERRLLPLLPNQIVDYSWDQKDPYGRDWQGVMPVSITVGYRYRGVYQDVDANNVAFAKIGGAPIDGDFESRTITVNRAWTSGSDPVGSWNSRGAGFGGWTLDGHHHYDSSSNTLEAGDGSHRATLTGSLVVRTLGAGGGSGAGAIATQSVRGVATQAMPENPQCITGDAEGNVFVGADYRVYRIASDGTSTVIAGDGSGWFNGDGIAALDAGIDPAGIAIGSDGAIYIADETNRRVRRVFGGSITTVAGNGDDGYGGDGTVPATGSPLTPFGVAVAPDGTLYVTDRIHNVVRSVDLCANEMWSLAGSGQDSAFARTGGAPEANAGEEIAGPTRIAVTSGGRMYVIAEGNAIYLMDRGGRLELVKAGESICGGYSCFPAESGDILVRGETLYYSSPSTNSIESIVGEAYKRVAGSGDIGSGGDGGFAQAARFNRPRDLFLRGDGALYVVDSGNAAIRLLEQPFPGLANGETAVAASDGAFFFVFDENGRHLRTVDSLFGTNVLSFGYDPDGYLVSITDVDGNVTTIERSGEEASAIVAPGGQRTELAYDANGYLRSITNPAGESHQFTYSALGLMTTMTTPRLHGYSFQYDTLGRLQSDHDPAGGSKTLARTGTARNYEVNVTTAEGRSAGHAVSISQSGTEVRTHIDDAGQATIVTREPSGRTTTSLPDGTFADVREAPDPRFGIQAPLDSSDVQHAGGFFSAISTSRSVDPAPGPSQPVQFAHFAATFNGRTFTSFFEGATRTVTTTSPGGRTVTYGYDARGHVTSIEVPGLAPVTFTWSTTGLLQEITQGTRSIAMTYDGRRRLATVTDPLTDFLSFGYDDADRLTSQTLPGGRTISLVADANGNVTSVTPPGRPAHLFSFDPVDMPVSYTPPGGAGEGATFDLDHRTTVLSRGDGRTVTLTYGAEDRLQSLTIARGEYAFTRDPVKGLLESVTAPDGNTLAFTYRGALLESATWSGADVSGTVEWSYDADQRLESETVSCPTTSGPSCDTVAYGHDDDDLLIQAGNLALSNDPANGLLSGTTLNDVTDAYGYNEHGEVDQYEASFAAQPLFAQALTRDAAGRIITRIETIAGVATTYEYGYDAARRLSSVKKDGVEIAAYTYDPNGNRLTHTRASGTASGTYDSEDRVQTYGSTSYVHTAAGNLQTATDPSGTTTYDYDELGNLTSATLPSGDVVDYVIDGLNRRVAKKRNGVVEQRWLYRSAMQIAAEVDASGDVTKRFVYASRSNVPDFMATPTGTYRLVSDHLGSVRLVVDSVTGAMAQRLDYDEFGNVLRDTNPGFQPFGFAGGLYDADTGLVRFGARDYDPRVGRWTAKDAIGFASGDTNLYGYVFNDPINWIDPLGFRLLSAQEGKRIIDAARRWKGTPYNNTPGANKGPKGPDGGADCSGSTWAIYGEAGYPYEYSPSATFRSNPRFKRVDTPQAGDVGWWKGHIAIYDADAEDEPGASAGSDIWSARRPGKPYGPAKSSWWAGEPEWYRYDAPEGKSCDCRK